MSRQPRQPRQRFLDSRMKTCDQCNSRFFWATTNDTTGQSGQNSGYEVVCATSSAFFCSPFCQSLWLTDQYFALEQRVFGDPQPEGKLKQQ